MVQCLEPKLGAHVTLMNLAKVQNSSLLEAAGRASIITVIKNDVMLR
jgi:hypothetical protein